MAHVFTSITMAGLQLAGLASGFDWKTLVDSLMSLERVPISRMESEQLLNTRRNNALTALGSRLNSLRTANKALNDDTLFSARNVTSGTTGSTWSMSAANATPVGTHSFNVTQLATTATRRGSADIASGIASSSDVSGVTLASLPTSTAVTAGTFTVNGQQVTVDPSDSLQDVFDAISTATSGDVTASYDEVTDTISLVGGSEIVLGAANDTSNFLAVAKLGNNGGASVTSGTSLGILDRDAALVDARLRTAVTAVDGSGNGSFQINGVAVDYNVNDDSLDDVIARINASGAGVSASYDSVADRLNLTNTVTGDLGVHVEESAGGLLGALGLGAGATLIRGVNAQFTVNNGDPITSTSNTLTSSAHGVEGLTITAASTGTQAITIAANTDAMKGKITAFIDAFNSVQTYIEDQTRITTSGGNVSTATLASNREIQDWARTLRGSAFAAVPGLTGSVNRLDSLGIDFVSGTNNLTIANPSKLEAALSNNAEDVDAFFNTAGTGFFDRFDDLMEKYVGTDGAGGYVKTQTTALTSTNKSLDEQIAAAEARLTQRRAILESGFIAMESAQLRIQQMQSQIENTFFSSSSSSTKK